MRVEWLPRREGTIPASLENRFGRLVSQLLWSRGWDDPATAEGLLDPRLESLTSPFTLKNMPEAAERVTQALMRDEKIVVYADYDIDGMSGLAILVSFFEACGAKQIAHYQPDRLAEGYGVHPAAIQKLAEEAAKVVITVDTGTTATEAAREAHRLGLTMIVTDHHQQIGELPTEALVVNPNQVGDTSGLNYLSGAGMAFYLAIAVRAKLRDQGYFTTERPQPDIREWLDLFVLGTIADHVELQGDNRALVKAGLKQLMRTKRPGLELLRKKALARSDGVNARDVAFSITPKLNAASRMGHAALSTELLLTRDEARAAVLVEEIFELNRQRSEIQAKIFDEAVAQAEVAPLDARITLVHGHWHEGVLGIVAAKLVERFGRPAIVLTQLPHDPSILRGSMRTIVGVSCVAVLESCRDLLLRFGGHEMAAGLQVEAAKLEEFRENLAGCSEQHGADGVARAINFDGSLPVDHLEPVHVNALDDLGPWGSGNPEPLFLMEGIDLNSVRFLKQQHVKIALPSGQEIIGFFKATEIEGFLQKGHQKIDALLRPEMNRFRGSETVQLKLEYVRPHQSLHSAP